VRVRVLVLVGGSAIALAGLACAATDALWLLLAARFAQGACIPALTTCLAAYLAKTLSPSRLHVVMGGYVAATVLGGMLGRLLGGLVEPLAGWRIAFVVASALVLLATLTATRHLPDIGHTIAGAHREVRYRDLLRRTDLLPVLFCGAAGQAVFSPVFNTLPYRFTEPALGWSATGATLAYLAYLVGIYSGPAAGRLSNRLGSGNTLIAGALLLAASLLLLLVPNAWSSLAALVGVCAGFFAVHAAAVGALNSKLVAGQGRANALYVLFYYIGAGAGVTWSAWVYQAAGWHAVMGVALAITVVPLLVGMAERRR
jgi:MFS transporter, YNFM family, putative membrane transport protein